MRDGHYLAISLLGDLDQIANPAVMHTLNVSLQGIWIYQKVSGLNQTPVIVP
jgi:hypothetical protein